MDKIKYIYLNNEPNGLIPINPEFTSDQINKILLHNTYLRENFQRDMIYKGISNSKPDDFVIIGDIDEIPNLKNFNFEKNRNKLIIFRQKMFYYKLNLFYKELIWTGSRACLKKKLKSPQWLRNIKTKKYPFWRLDTIFSKNKYNNIKFVDDGGWHFTNVREHKDLEKKLLNFLHHTDYEQSGLELEDLKRLIKEKRVMYKHKLDKKDSKWGDGEKLQKTHMNEMPKYIYENEEKYKKWLEL